MRTLWMIMVCLLSTLPATAAEFSAGFELGHAAGTGGQLQLGVADFAVGFPGSLRVSGSFAARDAGDPLAARHVFINDNTNGTPDETAAISVFSLDLVLPFTTFAGRPVQLYGGPRHARFKGTYEFIGGNEIFDIVSNEWGWGLGLESAFPMGTRAEMLLSAGVDYYLDGEIFGHDTGYLPDGTDINGRDDYTYEDAENAVNGAGIEPRLLLGVRWRL